MVDNVAAAGPDGRRGSGRARIVGWSHIPFGKLIEPDTEALMARVSLDALRDAGVGPEAIDGIYVGVMNNGFLKQDFHAALVALADERLAHVPATRLENACATGSAAIYAAADFIEPHQHPPVVIATSRRVGTRVSADTRAVAMVMPAEGPSLGITPSGTWMCTSWRRLNSFGIPNSSAFERT